MTPQTPQGAALSDADIENFYSEALDADCAEVNIYKFARLCVAADRRLTAEQGGAEPPKPFCHVVNMLEGLPESPSYIMLFNGHRLGNGFTHTALYTGEQLVAALTTQPQAEPAASDFRKALEHAINRHSMENGSNSPDFLLAEYLVDCLAAFDKVVTRREAWYGRAPELVATPTAPTEPT